MDLILLIRLILSFSIWIQLGIGVSLADLGKSAVDLSALISKFELKLMEAKFDLLEGHSAAKIPRRRSPVKNGRVKRNLESHTAFVPHLDHYREQLVIDRVSAAMQTPDWKCHSSDMFRFDAVHHARQSYTFGICNDLLSIFRANQHSFELLKTYRLNKEALALNHVKLLDPDTGEVDLFLLVLLPGSFDVYVLERDELVFIYSQDLWKDYLPIVKVFYIDRYTYFMLVKKEPDGRIMPGIFKLYIENSEFKSELVVTKALPPSSLVQMCVAGNYSYLFATNGALRTLDTYQFDGKNLLHHQIMQTSADVDDVSCFRMGATHFAAVITAGTLRIFQESEGIYELIQVGAGPPGLTSVLPLTPNTYRDETILLVQGVDTVTKEMFADLLVVNALEKQFDSAVGSTCHRQDDWNTLEIRSYDPKTEGLSCLVRGAIPHWISSAAGLILDRHLVVMVPLEVSGIKKLLMVTVDVHLERVDNPVLEQRRQVKRRKEEYEAVLKSFEERADRIEKILEQLMFYGGDVRLNGSTWNVSQLRIGNLTVSSEKAPPGAIGFNRDDWEPFMDVTINDVQNQIDQLEKLVESIENRLADVIYNGTSDPVVIDQLHVNGSVIVKSLQVGQLVLEELNGQVFDAVVNDTVRRNSDRLIEGLKTIRGHLQTQSLTAEKINDIDVQHIVRNDDTVRIAGDVRIEGPASIAGNLSVSGTLAGVDVAKDLLTSDDEHPSLMFAEPIDVEKLIVEGFINDQVMDEDFFDSILFNGSSGMRFQRATFPDLNIIGDLNVENGHLCGLDLSILNNVVHLDQDEIIAGVKTFDNVGMEQSLTVGKLNGLMVPEELVSRDSEVTLTAEKHFQGPVDVRSMTVDGLINGHRLEDVVTLGSSQNISGNVVISGGLNVTDDLKVETVNGIDYNSMMRRGVHPALLEQRVSGGEVEFRQPVRIAGTLQVGSQINGNDARAVFDDILYDDETNPLITGSKTFSNLNVARLELSGQLNGLNVSSDLLTTSTDQLITGIYNLTGSVDLATLNVSQINQYDLNQLVGDLVRLSGPQNISSHLQFDQLVVLEDLVVDGSINGVDSHQFLTAGIDQNFTVEQVLVDPRFQTLRIDGDLKLDGTTVNGIDLKDWDRRRVTKSTDQDITGHWNVHNAIFHDKLKYNVLNDLPVDEWADGFIRSDVDDKQVIEGDLNVDSLRVKGGVTTSEGVNGFERWDVWKEFTADTRVLLDLTDDVHFERLQSVDGSTVVDQSVNGFDLQLLVDDAIFIDDPNGPRNLTATKTFSNINVIGSANVDKVNGGNLMDQHLNTRLDQVIDSAVEFAAAVEMSSVSANTVNGLESAALFSPDALPQNIHEGDVVFSSDISVTALLTDAINGRHWNALVASLARTNQSNNFTKPITFRHLEIGGPIEVTDLNGVEPSAWVEDLVLSDVETHITGRKNFADLSARSLKTPAVRAARIVPDLTDAMDRAVRLDRKETVDLPVTFQDVDVMGDVRVGGTVNGHNFPDDFITLNSNQILEGDFTVDKLVSTGHIRMGPDGRINGLDLEDEFKNTWMADRPAVLEGLKSFSEPVKIQSDLNVRRSVNGMNFVEQVVPLQGDSVIYGAPIVAKLEVTGDVTSSGLINDVTLKDLAAKTLYSDEPVVSGGQWRVAEASVRDGEFLLSRSADINGLPLRFLIPSNLAQQDDDTEQIVDHKLYTAAQNWYTALKGAYYKIDYFEVSQSITMVHSMTSMLQVPFGSESVLLVGTNVCSSLIYMRSVEDGRYRLAGIVSNTHSVVKWIVLEMTDSEMLVVSLSKVSSNCRGSSSRLWRISKTDRVRMDLIQDLGRNVDNVVTVNADDYIQLMTSGDVVKHWTISRNPFKVESKMLADSSPGSANQTAMGSANSGLSNQFLLNSKIKLHQFAIGSDQLVAVVEPVDSSISGCSGVKIYSRQIDGHRLEHVIPACDVQDIVTFTFGNMPDHYVVLAERASVGVYRYQGSSGFIKSMTLPIPNAKTLQWIRHGEDSLLAVGKMEKIVVFKAVTIGDYIR